MDNQRPIVDIKRTNLKSSVTQFEYCGEFYEPGGIQICETHLLLACPGCGYTSGMRVGNPKPEKSPSWLMTGTSENLTLYPSINCIGCCGWHGFLENGVFRSC